MRNPAAVVLACGVALFPGCARTVDLSAHWVPGTYECQADTTTKTTTTVSEAPGSTRPESETLRMRYRLTVGAPEAGSRHVDLRILQVVQENGAGRRDTDVITTPVAGWEVFPILVRTPFRARVAPDGTMVEEGGDFGAAFDAMFQRVPPQAEAAFRTFRQQLEESPLFKRYVSTSLGNRKYLHGSTEVGASWSDVSETTVPLLGTAEVSTHYRLEGLEDTPAGKAAVVTGAGTMSAPGGKPVEIGPLHFTLDGFKYTLSTRTVTVLANDLLNRQTAALDFEGALHATSPEVHARITGHTEITADCRAVN